MVFQRKRGIGGVRQKSRQPVPLCPLSPLAARHPVRAGLWGEGRGEGPRASGRRLPIGVGQCSRVAGSGGFADGPGASDVTQPSALIPGRIPEHQETRRAISTPGRGHAQSLLTPPPNSIQTGRATPPAANKVFG